MHATAQVTADDSRENRLRENIRALQHLGVPWVSRRLERASEPWQMGRWSMPL
ncbi:MAG TPA: hypothetical protein VHD36_03090 [Pirellulales bacterium]|nr:hypothetical protein [Pirellulales bacterium]